MATSSAVLGKSKRAKSNASRRSRGRAAIQISERDRNDIITHRSHGPRRSQQAGRHNLRPYDQLSSDTTARRSEALRPIAAHSLRLSTHRGSVSNSTRIAVANRSTRQDSRGGTHDCNVIAIDSARSRNGIGNSTKGISMLTLTRRESETLVIGGNVRITIVRVKSGGRIVLGIDAPDDVTVDRLEVHERKILESVTMPRP